MNSIKRSYNAKLKGFKSSLISIGFMSLAIVLGQIFLWCGLSETAGLRRKLEVTPAKPRYIITEVGVGYRLVDE